MSQTDVLDTRSSKEPGRANRAWKQRLIAAASDAGAEVYWLTAEEVDLVVPAKPVLLTRSS